MTKLAEFMDGWEAIMVEEMEADAAFGALEAVCAAPYQLPVAANDNEPGMGGWRDEVRPGAWAPRFRTVE